MKFSLGAVAAIALLSSSHGFTLSRQQNVGRACIASTPGVAHAQSQIGISAQQSTSTSLFATIEETAASPSLDGNILSKIKDSKEESKGWAEAFDLSSESGAAFHALFSGIRSSTLGPKGIPYYLKSKDVVEAIGADGFASENNGFDGFFSFDDLTKALEEDFLDADRGTTDNRKGWRVSAVSTPRGSSFEDARMTLNEVNVALEKGTVIFNTAGSHIPKLAGATLACTDASALPCAANMYITAAGKRTSAPPHTDKQDVIVVQTQGKKHWRVYSPPDPSMKPNADMYARGKGQDNLPLYSLEDDQYGCKLLLDVTLEAGDVLFIPAAFPHTTDTVMEMEDAEPTPENTSIHLTFNFDTHVWDLNYLSARRLALRRAGIADSALGQEKVEDNPYVGNVNLLPKAVRDDLLSNLPLDFLDDMKPDSGVVDTVISETKRIAEAVDKATFDEVPPDLWKETVEKIQAQGMELFDIHRDMYLAAIEEGRERKNEAAMTAHLSGDALARATVMTQEKMQRLSLFRVQKYFEKITEAKQTLIDWSLEGKPSAAGESDPNALPDDWAFSLPVNVGDQVEADLGGAFFPATVTKAGGSYDVKFFDGDVMDGLARDQIKLMTPPAATSSNSNDADSPPPGLTKKELKRWRKKQEKAKAKKGF